MGKQLIGNQAGHGCNQGPQTAQVHTYQQIPSIFGEFRQKQSRRHITDRLAGHNTNHNFIACNQTSQNFTDQRNAAHVPYKYEEKHKGQNQTVVHPREDVPVDDKNRSHDKQQHCKPVEESQYRSDGHQKQGCVHTCPAPLRMHRCKIRLRQTDFCLLTGQHQHHQKHQCHCHIRQHRFDKLRQRKAIVLVNKEILRIAHRSQHTAQIGCDSLQHDGRHQQFRMSGFFQNKDGEGYESQQGHIVGESHAEKEAEQNQHHDDGTGI